MKTKELIFCAFFIVLIAIGAHIKIPVPIVPFTLQFLFTMLAGLLLGSKLGFIAVASYVFCGLAGLPVFAEGGGLGYILNPTFGYLVGYAAATFITGLIAEKYNPPDYEHLLLANFAGLIVLYIFGMIYCYAISNFYLNISLGLWPLFLYCFLLPIPGDIALCFAGAFLAKKLIPLIKIYKR